MTRLLSISWALMATIALAGCASHEGGGGCGGGCCGGARPTAVPMTAARPLSGVCNTVCPVMGQPVDPSVPTSVYMGKTVGFCCMGCKPKFDANPALYASKLP